MRRTIRNAEYYSGTIELVATDEALTGGNYADFRQLMLAWYAYEGGSVELHLTWEELEKLRDAATMILAARRKAPRA